jgi:hypothetical protein
MQDAKSWVAGDLAYRRGSLETKIRRATDYAEQLQAEIDELTLIQGDVTVDGSLAFIINGIETLLSDRNYMAASNDAGKDPYGKQARAPFAPYMPAEGASIDAYERTLDGPREPTTGTNK